MKIPMEIPEAFESATKEIIDFECEAEMVRLAVVFALCATLLIIVYCQLLHPHIAFVLWFFPICVAMGGC